MKWIKYQVFLLSVIIIIIISSYGFETIREYGKSSSQPCHTAERFNRPTSSLRYPNFKRINNFSIDEFYPTDLIQNPELANTLSKLLPSRKDVIFEAQRIHMHIFGNLLRSYRYAMLFDYSPSENKGDSAIAVGEMILLRKLKIEVIFACKIGTCTVMTLEKAARISKTYSERDLVILFHGGGNVIGYQTIDKYRFSEIEQFRRFNIVMFPQSIFYRGPQSHINLCKRMYASHNLTFIWRDMVSFRTGRKLFPNVKSLLAPDIAYQIGHVDRFMHPSQDILWIKREDVETPGYTTRPFQGPYRIHISDWLYWKTPKGTSPMEDIFLMTTNGLMFLQRGRIVVTDRLHGHILSTLLDIPHIYIDNKEKKISNYHNTWTASVENIVLAESAEDALVQAQNLLIKLDRALPNITGFNSH